MARKRKEVPSAEPEQGTAARQIEFCWLPIDKLIPNSWNVNVEDEATFNMLLDEISDVGLIDPIEVVPLDQDTYVIIGGEHRWRAAKQLNHAEVPCILLTAAKFKELDLQKFISVRMNVIRGKMDPEKFVSLYNELVSKYGTDAMQRLMGFVDSNAFQKMLGWVKKGLKDSLPKEMASKVDEATKEAKSVEDIGKIVQNLFNEYGSTLNQSFMVFTYGKQKHLYISMDAKMRAAMDKVVECCQLTGADINDFMRPITEEFLREAVLKIEEAKVENKSAQIANKDSEW